MENKVFLFGLDSAGKTTLYKKIKENSLLEDPEVTRAFNIDDMIINDIKFIIWDAPGQITFRKIWSTGLPGTSILLFVLDTSNLQRFDEAKKELDKVLNNLETRTLPLIVCFNKIDLKSAQENYVSARGLIKLPLIKDHEVFRFKTSAKTGEGIEEIKTKLVELVQKTRW